MARMFMYHTDHAVQEIMKALMAEHSTELVTAGTEAKALDLVTSTKYDRLFLEFWRDSELSVYTIIKAHCRKWGPNPEIVLMQQSPIPTKLFGIVDEYRVLNMPFSFDVLGRVLK